MHQPIKVFAPAAVICNGYPDCQLLADTRRRGNGDSVLLQVSHNIEIQLVLILGAQFVSTVAKANHIQGRLEQQLQPGRTLN